MDSIKDIFNRPEYVIAGICISFGALAHGLEEIRKGKWRGWVWFIADMVICAFAGFIFYQIAQITFPQYTYLYCSLGSFWGTKGFKFIYAWFMESLKVLIDNEKNGRTN